ncbi:MAG: MFS transporter [Thermoleophilia bacterium]|nr:MFS transporter [Thermoleophilia bacterium]
MPVRRNITLLVGGIGASLFGDGMFVVAIGFAVFAVGGGPGALGMVLLAGVGTIFACILPAGVVVDRMPRRHVLAVCDAARCVLQLLAAAIVAHDGAHWTWLLPGSILFGAATALHQPATMSFVADVAPSEELEKVNGSLQAIRGLGIVVGGALAGVIVATWGPVPVMVVDAATFAVCAACIFAIRLPASVEQRAPARVAGGPTGIDDVRAAVSVVRSHPWLVHGLLLIAGFVVVSYGPIQVVGPQAASDAAADAGVSASVLWAWISAATAIGMIAGAVAAIMRPVAETMNALRVLLVLGGLGPIGLAAGVEPLATLPGFAAIGAAMGLFSSGWESTKQSRIEPRMLARVASLDMFAQLTGMVAGVTVAAALATFVSTSLVLWWIGCGCAVLAVASWFSPALTGVFRDRAGEVRMVAASSVSG